MMPLLDAPDGRGWAAAENGRQSTRRGGAAGQD